MFPNPKGGEGGHIVFGVDPFSVSFFSVLCLLNQMMDFDQTCLEGGGYELIRF